jgi:hypothetical protein
MSLLLAAALGTGCYLVLEERSGIGSVGILVSMKLLTKSLCYNTASEVKLRLFLLATTKGDMA